MTKTGKIISISALSLVMATLVLYGALFGRTPAEILAENPSVSAEEALQTAARLSSIAETAWKNETAASITLADDGTVSSASGVQVQGNSVTVRSSGVYSVSGCLTDGQLAVDCEDTVILILNGVDISNSSDAAICVSNADSTLVWLPGGSANRLVSGRSQEITAASENSGLLTASGAALYARDSLSIGGTGKLSVGGYINNAIATTDHLVILGGELDIVAVNNGLKGKDSVTVVDGSIDIQSGNDGIKSENTAEAGYGSIDIRGGEITIVSLGDGIHAEEDLTVEDGVITVSAGDITQIGSGSMQSPENFPGNMAGSSLFEAQSIEGITENGDGSITVTAEAADRVLALAKELFGDTGVTAEQVIACSTYAELSALFAEEMGSIPGDSGEMQGGFNPQSGATPPPAPDGTAGSESPENTAPSDGRGGGKNPQGGTPHPNMTDFGTGGAPGGQTPPGTVPPQTDGSTGGQAPSPDIMGGPGGMSGDLPDMFDREWSYGSGSDTSTKGLKCGGNLTVTGGNITVNSVDDCVHANGSITVLGGVFTLATSDDGFHADDTLTVSGGDITVSQSYEGLEGHLIYIEGGTISVTASDDGLNAGGGSSATLAGFFSQTAADDSSLSVLKISGGTLLVNANGDGLDSNGDLIIEGGYTVVDGPTNDGNGALDSGSENGGSILCNGGTVLAIGGSGMAESFESDSTQCSFIQKYSKTFEAGTRITVANEAGNVFFEYSSAKTFNSVVFSSPELILGNTYTVTVGDETDTVTMESISNGDSFGSGMTGGSGAPGGPGMQGGPGTQPNSN